jgi:DUF4097 and DUF4098 domain-containing protein YvlB
MTTHPRNRLPPALVAILLAWPLAACELATASFRAEAKEPWTRTFAMAGDGRFELENTNGSIEVEPAGGKEIQVRAEKIAKAGTEDAAKDLLNQVEIIVEESAERVKLRTKSPKGISFGSTEVKYFVQVPAGVQVKVENTNGGVRLSGLGNSIDATTTNGGVRGKELSGPVRASTTNGGVDIDVAAVHAGGIELSTTNGGVSLHLPADGRADVTASCVNGGISADGLEIETSESSRRRLHGRLNGGGPRVRLETTNGGIRLRPRTGQS